MNGLTPMATTKLRGLFVNPNALEMAREHRYDTSVCTIKIAGMIARSISLSAVS